jgi:hypothetical protein
MFLISIKHRKNEIEPILTEKYTNLDFQIKNQKLQNYKIVKSLAFADEKEKSKNHLIKVY